METRTRNLNYFWYLSAAIVLLAGAATVLAEEEPQPRISTSSEGQGIQRDGSGSRVITHDELEPLVITGSRSKTTRGSEQKASSDDGSQSSNNQDHDFWIFDASVILFSDQDQDGYYSGIDLSFDADTIYDEADVYAVIYLSYELGPWNEYASTQDFTIFGASGDDEYVIATDLVSGYLTGQYDLLIELFDAFDGSFVASFGPDDSSQLSFLPLEDAGRDTPVGTTTTIIIDEGGGGSLGLLSLLLLLGVSGSLRIRRR